ncbi:transposase [Mesorhizobium sp.]|uniref:transposase n=1 Tax=Mesorhizobium sp. TaxID=1871066 RepID=UPI00338DC0C5
MAGPSPPLPAADRADHRPDRTAGPGRRTGPGRREAGEPVRAACRYHRQGQPRRRLWSQDQSDDRSQRTDPRSRHRSGQPSRQRASAANAGAPHRVLRRAGASGGGRRRLCQPRQSAPGQGLGRARYGVPQEEALRIEDVVSSRWVYRKLRNFRAGIEASISCLKRACGLARCTWRGLNHFKAYVWSSVVAYNLALFTRLSST